jgi:hypothetical protein
VTGAATLSSTLAVTGATGIDGDFDINTNKFTVASATGNTAVAGTLGVTGATTLSSTLGVTGTTTLGTANITTADINGGNIDGTIIGATTAAAITGTTITGTSFVTSGDMTFGDNDKAIFGTGSDLQIYHSGGGSFISEVGAGNLFIQGESAVAIQNNSSQSMAIFNSGADVQLRYATTTRLATTSTGVDITGTLTSDGLTVDGSATEVKFTTTAGRMDLFLTDTDTTDGQVRVRGDANSLSLITDTKVRQTISSGGDISFYEDTGTTAKLTWDASAEMLTTSGLTVDGDARFSGTASTLNYPNSLLLDYFPTVTGTRMFSIGPNSSTEGQFEFHTSTTTANKKRLSIATGGDISFYEDTGTTAKFFWDASAESLAIGAASTVGVGESLYLAGGGAVITGDISSYNVNALMFGYDGSNAKIAVGGTSGASRGMTFSTVSGGVEGERMRIDSSGNVGIGTSSPSAPLSVTYAGGAVGAQITGNASYAQMQLSAAGANTNSYFTFGVNGTGKGIIQRNATDVITIDSSGNVGIGTADPDYNLVVGDAGATANAYIEIGSTTTGTGNLFFGDTSGTGAGSYSGYVQYNHNTDSMILGTNSTERMRIDSSGNLLVGKTAVDTSVAGTVLSSGNYIFQTRDSAAPLLLRRNTNDGNIAEFYKDGTSVGSIGVVAGDIVVGSGSAGLRFLSTGPAIQPRNADGTANNDAIDLGLSGNRFKDLYLSGSLFSGATSGGAKVVAEAIATGTTYSASWPATGGTALYMQVNSSAVGSITTTASATAYNTSSDYRLKTDVQPMTGATDRLKQLNPVNFEWIADGTRVDGFLAHEAQAVVPEAVTGSKDAMRDEEYEITPAVLDDDGNVVTEAVMGTRSVPDYQGIDQSKLVPLLVATIKELEARITALENA